MEKSPTLIRTSNEMKTIPFLLEFIESLQTQEDIWISTPTIMQGTKEVLSCHKMIEQIKFVPTRFD